MHSATNPIQLQVAHPLCLRVSAVHFGPGQAMPFNIEDTDLVGLLPIKIPLFLGVSGDRHTWDTIILCSLTNGLFGRIISSQEVADVINARDGRIDDALGSDSVRYMFEAAKLTQFQEATTCQYQKWAGVKNRLEARQGQRDFNDKVEWSAWILYSETLMTADLIASGRLGLPRRPARSSVAGPQRGE